MEIIKLLIICIFLHIVDDYYLQGWLASAKQKSWWEENAPSELYKYDYIWALIMHSFSWSFIIMLPFLIGGYFGLAFVIIFLVNLLIHALTDNAKANIKSINLWTDQLIHVIQIVITVLTFTLA